LQAAGVADVATARELDRRRHELVAARDRLQATSAALAGDESADQLRTRLAELTADELPVTDLFDVDGQAAREELDAATAAQRQAIADCETHRKVAEAARKRLGERSTRLTVLTEKLTGAQRELEQ